MGWYAIETSEAALRKQTLSVLRASSSAAEAELREFLLYLKQATLALSDDPRIADALADRGPTPDRTEVEEFLNWRMTTFPEASELIVVDTGGNVVASSDKARNQKDLSSALFFAKGQSSFFPGELRRDESGQVSWIMSAPVRDSTMRRLLGIVAVRINPESLNALTSGQRLLAQGADTQPFRIGETGETYIVDRHGFIITPSQSVTNAILQVKVDTLPVQAAIDRNEEITSDYRDYRGVPVSGASAIIREMGWVVLTEIDFRQVFAPVKKLRSGLLWLGIGLGILVTGLAWRTARWIVRPLQLLKHSDHARRSGPGAAAAGSGRPSPARRCRGRRTSAWRRPCSGSRRCSAGR